MKRLTAFFTAFVLFLVTAAGIHLTVRDKKIPDSHTFSTWANETKTRSRETIKQNLNSHSLLVFGSSEFMHGQDTPYHPSSMFADSDFQPMLIGAGYYQSLSHAIALSALGEGQKKAVLFLSPQWFRKTGVLPQAFASRFSENDYMGMLQNETLSKETKQYIIDRTHTLLKDDPKTQNRLTTYERVWNTKTATSEDTLIANAWQSFLNEKEKITVPLLFDLTAKKTSPPAGNLSINWTQWLSKAEKDGARYQENQFYIDDKNYKKLKPRLSKKKDCSKKAIHGYGSSPEYDDLRCFLNVCRDMDIKPLLVILPVNGYYYDYTGFPQTARETYYSNIQSLAETYNAELADFSADEYTKYFFEDQVHIGRKGWVLINESLYNFYKEP